MQDTTELPQKDERADFSGASLALELEASSSANPDSDGLLVLTHEDELSPESQKSAEEQALDLQSPHWSAEFPDWVERLSDPELGYHPAKVKEIRRILHLIENADEDSLRVGFGTVSLPADVVGRVPQSEQQAFRELDDLELERPLSPDRKRLDSEYGRRVMQELEARLPETIAVIREDLQRLGLADWTIGLLAIRANHPTDAKGFGWHIDDLSSEYDPRTPRWLIADRVATNSMVGENHISFGGVHDNPYDQYTGKIRSLKLTPATYKPGDPLANRLGSPQGAVVEGSAGGNYDIQRFGLADVHCGPYTNDPAVEAALNTEKRTFIFLHALPPDQLPEVSVDCPSS